MRHRQIAAAYLVCSALFCGLSAYAWAAPAAAESPPYEARVLAAGAAVHSGPGDNYYPTDSLSQGDVVEVYREKAGGWLAIRPPVNSFSWVAGKDLILKDGGLAEVVRDGVASRIGSRLNDRHNASQVRLKKGEAVEVIGEENINGEKWCKIPPPAGEFRWIQASLVERSGQGKGLGAGDSGLAKNGTPSSDVNSKSAEQFPAPGTQSPPATQQSLTNSTTPTPSPQSPIPNPSSADPSHDLSAIELRLSRMAAAPASLWNTERLERDTAQLMGRAKTPAERDAVRVTQDKINRFNEICRRNSQSPAIVAQSGQPAGAGSGDPRTSMGDPRTTVPTPQSNSTATATNSGPYDAVGILRSVVSRRPGAPQFALVDERGQVVTFVTSTPDLNLQPYLGHRIGVVGSRGYMPEFQRATVTAARVQPLNDRMLR